MIARDISEAGSYFQFHRLPELYAGARRTNGTFPVQYLGANVPQAWAAGSVFHLVQPSWASTPMLRKNNLSSIPSFPSGYRT